MADLKVGKGQDVLITSSLGSCVAICLYDQQARVAGMAHIMLPDSQEVRHRDNPAKFADSAIPVLIEEMTRQGAEKRRLVAKIAGGAQMFMIPGGSPVMRIGERNVAATRAILERLGIPLAAEDTGSNYGRSVEFNARDGSLRVRSIGHGEKEL